MSFDFIIPVSIWINIDVENKKSIYHEKICIT